MLLTGPDDVQRMRVTQQVFNCCSKNQPPPERVSLVPNKCSRRGVKLKSAQNCVPRCSAPPTS